MIPIEDQLRSIVLEALRKWHTPKPKPVPYSLHQLLGDLAFIAQQRGLKTRQNRIAWTDVGGRQLDPNLRRPILDVVWDLIVEGVLRPGEYVGPNEDPFKSSNLPYLHVTDYGKTVLDGSVTPDDPDGYIHQIEALVPNVDSIIVQYIAESARTLRFNCLLSSTITLGCASEKTFLLLLDSYIAALNPTNKTQLDRDLKNKSFVKMKHTVFMRWFDAHLKPLLKADPQLKGNWLTTFETVLRFLWEHFREVRNRAGHPTGYEPPRQVVYGRLIFFPSYLRTIYDLIEWLDARKGKL